MELVCENDLRQHRPSDDTDTSSVGGCLGVAGGGLMIRDNGHSYLPILTKMFDEMQKKHYIKGYSYLEHPVWDFDKQNRYPLKLILDEEIWELWKELDELKAGFNGDHLENAITEATHVAIAALILADKLRVLKTTGAPLHV